MTTESEATEQEHKPESRQIIVKNQGSSGSLYGIGLIGAWVYYIGRATTNQERVRGFFKAFAWPGVLVYELLKFFKKE
jgi:hypothetical protein